MVSSVAETPFFADLRPTVNIAHRGGAALYPENTLQAFDAALNQNGAHMIETDVHLTGDGEVVVFHDRTLARTTNGNGRLEQMSWAKLSQLDAGYQFTPDDGQRYPFRGQGYGISRLSDVLDAFPCARFNIDLKLETPRLVEAVAHIVVDQRAQHRVCLGSEFDSVAALLATALPEVVLFFPKIALMECMMAIMNGDAAPLHADYQVLEIPLSYAGVELVTDELLERTLRAGYWVNVWTINDQETMAKLIQMGVGGIMTDHPDRLDTLLRGGGQSTQSLPKQ